MVEALEDLITLQDGEEYIEDENDVFHLQRSSKWSLTSIADALPSIPNSLKDSQKADENDDQDKIIDYNKIVKRLLIHDQQLPESKETPYFNHHAYYANLKHYESQSHNSDPTFGRSLLYGEVVTSTNTLLEKYLFL